MKAKMEQLPAKNPNPVLSVSKDGTILYSNEAGEPLLIEWGVEIGDKLPSYIEDLVQMVISGNSPTKIEVKAGKITYLVAFHPLPEDECVNIYGFDISCQKEFEEKLRESEEKHRDIIETAIEGIWILDAEFRTSYVNQKMAEILGYNQEEIIDRFPWDFADEESKNIIKLDMEKRRQGISEILEIKYISSDGSPLWVQVSSKSLFDKTGKFTGVLGMLTDITERKQVDEALQRERGLLESVMQTTDVMLVFFDAQFNFIWVNPAYAETCHMKPEEMVGKNHFTLYPHEENESIFRQVRDTGEGVFYKDKPFVFPDQPERGITYWDWSLAPVKDSNGNVVGLVFSLRETTKYKQAEDALRGSEERYRGLFESSVDGIIITDLAGNILKVNPTYEKMLGYSSEELQHMSYQQLTPARWHENEARIVREQIFEHGYSDEYEKEYIRKDGSTFPISIRVWLSRDKQGQPLGMWGLVRDITERKRAEESLRVSEANLARAQRITLLGNWSWDIIGDRIVGSHEFLRMLGFEHRDYIVYSDFIARLHPEDRERVNSAVQAALSDTMPYFIDYRIVLPESMERVIHAEGEVNRDNAGQPVAMFGTVQDITERKRAEEALKMAHDTLEEKVKERTAELEQAYESLKESEKSLAEAQEMAHIGNWNRNLVTNELYWSKEMYRIFGFSPQDFIVTYDVLLSHLHPEDRDHVDNAVKKAIKGEPFDIDYRIISTDGKERVVHAQGKATFDEENNPVRIRGTVQDITERKKAEEALERMDKIRIKEIHHRIKNNLQVISSLLDLQAEKFEEEKVKEAFREGQNRVISMSLLHEELYKGEGADTLDFSSYLKKLAENLFSTYNLYSKNVHLSIDLEDNAFIDMDTAVPLGIIVNELVSNSLKHAFTEDEEGEIRIRLCRHEETSDEMQKSNFSLTISDDGKGIPEDLELENAESLGLQLVGILVDQLDGELELKRDNGTEFTIKFNVTEHNKTSAPAQQQLVD